MRKPKHSPPAKPRRKKAKAKVVDLETLAVDDAWLIRKVKSTRDTAPLIEYLRDGRGKVGAELQVFIADILDGTTTRTPTGRERLARTQKQVQVTLEGNKACIRAALNDNEPASYKQLESALRTASYKGHLGRMGCTATKGQITSAAEHLTQRMHGLTKSQLDRLIYPRKRDRKERLHKKT